MKKQLIAVLLCALLLLTACAAKPAATAKPLPECAELGNAILQSQTFTEEMMELSESKLLRALVLDEGSYSAAWMSLDVSQTTPEAVIVITAPDEQQAASIAAKLEAYRADTLRQYQDYRPEEAPKLENAHVLTNGTQCVLVICADQAKAEAACNAAWGK